MKNRYGMSTCIGEVITGLPYPVFFDPHYPIQLNNPPVTQVTGSPGSGKTFFGLVLAAQASILGKTGMILDPKGDFICLKQLSKAGLIGETRIWTVADSNGQVLEDNIGMLDPMLFYKNRSSNIALTKDIIKELIGELSSKQETTLTPIIEDVAESSYPSFLGVVKKLATNRDDDIRAISTSLSTILNTPLAKLLTAEKRKKRTPFEITKGLTVANLMNLKLPPDNKPVKKYKSEEKISVIIMELLGYLVLDLMKNKPKSLNKLLIIDEAWAVMATESGRNMVNAAARLGRSMRMATILLTQSSKQLSYKDSKDLDTMISTRFAFRNNDSEDNLKTCKLMGLPEGEGMEEVINNLETGECLMQDVLKQKSIIHIMAEDDWIEIFNTNPIEKAKR